VVVVRLLPLIRWPTAGADVGTRPRRQGPGAVRPKGPWRTSLLLLLLLLLLPLLLPLLLLLLLLPYASEVVVVVMLLLFR
jgi:hypothetical protein